MSNPASCVTATSAAIESLVTCQPAGSAAARSPAASQAGTSSTSAAAGSAAAAVIGRPVASATSRAVSRIASIASS